MSKLIEVNTENPEKRKIDMLAANLKKGSVIIFPTDTVYAIGCSIYHKTAIERICKIKNVKLEKSLFSFICKDLSNASQYAKQIDNSIFKVMKRCLPGPFTFILKASHEVPKILQYKRKTIGIRISKHAVPTELVNALGHPLIISSLPKKELELEYYTDPSLINETYEKLVDYVIDGGIGGIEESTVVDCTAGELEIIREGMGEL